MVLAKLWSVIPRLFVFPPVRSIAQLLERVSLLMLVGGILFEIVTGVLNIQYDYIFGFSFYTAHYFGAWVFIAGFVMHVAIKGRRMWAGLRSLSLRDVLRTGRADTKAEPWQPDGLVAAEPGPATMSRRGALALVGGGRPFPGVPHRRPDAGWLRPAGRPATAARATPRPTSRSTGPRPRPASPPGTRWSAGRLTLNGGHHPVVLDRAALLAMPQHTAILPIACVEGWSTTQTWTGVRLADLARLAGVPAPDSARVSSLERSGAFAGATLQRNQVLHPDALLALRVNGTDLSPDHGFPARIIVPALPGVHNTKWVASIAFRKAAHA